MAEDRRQLPGWNAKRRAVIARLRIRDAFARGRCDASVQMRLASMDMAVLERQRM